MGTVRNSVKIESAVCPIQCTRERMHRNPRWPQWGADDCICATMRQTVGKRWSGGRPQEQGCPPYMGQKALGFLAKSGCRVNRFTLQPLFPAAAAELEPPAAAEPGRWRPRGWRRGKAGIRCYHEWEQYFAWLAHSVTGHPPRSTGQGRGSDAGGRTSLEKWKNKYS